MNSLYTVYIIMYYFFLGGVIINIFPLFSPTNNKWLCSLAKERQDTPAFTSSLVIFARPHDTHKRVSGYTGVTLICTSVLNSRQVYTVLSVLVV